MINLKESLKQNPFLLAPMAGITDCAFRSFMKELGVGVVVTELVSATGIEYASEKTLSLMKFEDMQRPIGIQLFGEDPEVMARAARVAQDRGCDFVDLNFGCPVPKVVKKGGGSAILRDLKALEVMLKTVKQDLQIPLTIKIRTGWDSQTRNADQVIHIAADQGVSWVAIHGRTRAQGYEGLADWDYMAQVKTQSPIPIIGNGDILTANQAVSALQSYGMDGVMIGRGALKNPRIFLEALAIWQGNQQRLSFNEVSLLDIYKKLLYHLEQHCEGQILQIQMRKFAAWFATGYSGAANFRKGLFQTKSLSETKELVFEFFSERETHVVTQTNHEPFLMGGHG